jgi:hypothetical protein
MHAIRDTSVVPAEDWTYYVQPTNFTVRTKNYTQLYTLVKQHCLSNGVNPPDQQTVIEYVCANSHVPCYDTESGGTLTNPWSLDLPLPPRTGSCCGG